MTGYPDIAHESVHRSASPGGLAVVFSVLFVASVATGFLLTGFAPYPVPYMPVDQIQHYYTRYPDAVRIVSFLQMAAAIPLGLFAVTMVSRLLFHRVHVAGVYIALFGGVGAAAFLGISALADWTLSQPAVATDLGAMRVASLLGFAAGGFGHTSTLGLLLAGISVPCLAFGLMPRWIGWLGIFLAVVAEGSLVSMVVPSLSPLLTVARFPALIWLIAAGFALPKTRQIPVPQTFRQRAAIA